MRMLAYFTDREWGESVVVTGKPTGGRTATQTMAIKGDGFYEGTYPNARHQPQQVN